MFSQRRVVQVQVPGKVESMTGSLTRLKISGRMNLLGDLVLLAGRHSLVSALEQDAD
jgi:hypothetical protein